MIEKLDFIFAKGKAERCCLRHAAEDKPGAQNTDQEWPSSAFRSHNLCTSGFRDWPKDKRNYYNGAKHGGKTVAIKTVGLYCLMAQCGLHLPCGEADICMNSQILCDIGDGQNMTENLSTFSAHITNALDILETGEPGESLVVMDELGSGTDPAEGESRLPF